VISSSMVIPKVSLTRSLIPKIAAVWIKSKSVWSLCISHMWRLFQRSSDIQGIYMTLGPSSKLNTLLGVHSWKPGWKEILSRRHSASSVFPVNVAEATFAKQADL
jgi:hypothetical protein